MSAPMLRDEAKNFIKTGKLGQFIYDESCMKVLLNANTTWNVERGDNPDYDPETCIMYGSWFKLYNWSSSETFHPTIYNKSGNQCVLVSFLVGVGTNLSVNASCHNIPWTDGSDYITLNISAGYSLVGIVL